MTSLADRIRRGEPIPLPLALLLHAATPIQRIGMWRRARQPVVKVNARVISFGNITAGGTGKTPAVIERAEREVAAGHRVAVVTRGYGSRRVKEPFVVRADENLPDLVDSVGDEPALIRQRVPEVTLVKSADRVAGAKAAVHTGCDTILLDDGYQSLSLYRDENIICMDAVNPFGSGHLIPRGILRESLSALTRATEIILTRCDQVRDLEELIQTIRQWLPDAPIRRTRHAPVCLSRVSDGAEAPLAWLQKREVIAACAIGHPEAFVQTLKDLGAQIGRVDASPDHDAMSDYKWSTDYPTVITEKDAVRTNVNVSREVYALRIALEDQEAE